MLAAICVMKSIHWSLFYRYLRTCHSKNHFLRIKVANFLKIQFSGSWTWQFHWKTHSCEFMSTFPVFVKYLVRSQTISPENSYSFFRLALFWMIFYFQPLIIQLSPWKCVYPHTSGSRPNHFHNQLLVVEAFLITNIPRFVYFYDFNENVRYIFSSCVLQSLIDVELTKRLRWTHIGWHRWMCVFWQN